MNGKRDFAQEYKASPWRRGAHLGDVDESDPIFLAWMYNEIRLHRRAGHLNPRYLDLVRKFNVLLNGSRSIHTRGHLHLVYSSNDVGARPRPTRSAPRLATVGGKRVGGSKQKTAAQGA